MQAQDDLGTAAVRLINEADHPMTQGQIATSLELPKEERQRLRDELHRLESVGELHRVSGRAFWTQNLEEALIEAAREVLGDGPRTRTDLVEALRERLPFASAAARQRAVRTLATSPDVVSPKGRPIRLSHEPTPAARGLEEQGQEGRREALLHRFDSVVAELEAIGEMRGTLVRRLQPEASVEQSQAGTEDAELAYDVAMQLAVMWRDYPDPTTREALRGVMLFVGMKPLGEVGEAVAVDGIRHVTPDDLWPDDPALVETPGWTYQPPGRFPRVLEKCVVRGATKLESK